MLEQLGINRLQMNFRAPGHATQEAEARVAYAKTEPVVVGSILIGADTLVGEIVKSRIPHMRGQSWGEHTTLGVVRRGRLVGGVVYYGYRGFDVQVGIAFDSKSWALPGTLRALCAYPFHQLGCKRVTAVTSRKNKTARAMLVRAGFRFEGVIRCGLDGMRDGLVYGLLKHECKWLKARITSTAPR